MPEFTKTTPGTFCWFDVVAPDATAARKFFGELFAWSFEEMPMPAGAPPYAMAKVGGKLVGGIALLQGEAKKMNVPPHLMSYIAVDDTDATLAKVAGLGGKVMMPATDNGPGRMAVVQDPTGATVALWQSKQAMGTWLYGENSAMCWNELMTTDVAKASDFYTKLFGWTTETMPMPMGSYTILKNRGEMAGGLMAMPPDAPKGMPSVWGTYLQIPNADQTVARAQKMGGKVLHPATDAANVGRFAMLADPQGAAFGILQPAPKR